MNRHTRGLAALLVVFAAGTARAADGPKAYVITGWNTGANDKAWHDRIADEAERDLRAAGYKVTRITEATKAQFKAAMEDESAKAMVFIDHGTSGQARVRLKDENGEARRSTAGQFGGPLNNFDIMTIHACDQDRDEWKDLFPNADFHSWGGCIYPSDELRWQQKKEYRRADEPQADDTSDEISEALQEGQFDTQGEDAFAYHPLGNWPMEPGLAALFGQMSYNLLIFDNLPPQPPITRPLFSARVAEGIIIQNEPAQQSPTATFSIIFNGAFWDMARHNPQITLEVSPTMPGSPVQIIPHVPVTPDQIEIMYAGVRRNLFGMPPSFPCPPCAADFNRDGGVDGSDVESFFTEWENGLGCADVNLDGGIDGADVEFFFAVWQEGGC